MIDIKELRRLAEAATPGEWKLMYSARKSNPSEKDKFYSVSALSPAIPGWCDAKNIDIATVCKIYDGTDASNSAFIAAANPSAILSLLDKIDVLVSALQMAKHVIANDGTQEQLDEIFEALESVGVKP